VALFSRNRLARTAGGLRLVLALQKHMRSAGTTTNNMNRPDQHSTNDQFLRAYGADVQAMPACLLAHVERAFTKASFLSYASTSEFFPQGRARIL
jgi:hypothetical protein